MSVLKNFKNTPGRPKGVTGLRCNFFFKFATRSMAEKNERATCRPPTGDRVPPPYIRPGRHSLVI